MYEVSQDYVDAIVARNRYMFYRLDVMDDQGHTLNVSRTSSVSDLLFKSGSVTADATASVRRHATLQIVDPLAKFSSLVGDDLFSSTSGNSFKLYAGPRLITGKIDLKPLGVYDISDSSVEDSKDGGFVINIDGYDHSRKLQRAKYTKPFTVKAGHNVIDEVMTILQDRMPGIRFSVDVDTAYNTTHKVLDENTDPWATALEMLLSAGLQARFDVNGTCVIEEVPDTRQGEVAWVYSCDKAQCIVTDLTVKSSNENVPNGIVLVGESSSTTNPPRAEVWDTDANSITYSGYDPGTQTFEKTAYGIVPEFVTDNNVHTHDQAVTAANARFRKRFGKARSVQVSLLPNPAHEPDDQVRIQRHKLQMNETFILQSFELPIGTGDLMTATVREISK